VLSEVNYLLLYLAALTFTVGAPGLVVGAVLLAFPLYLDRSYVDGLTPFVVSIFDTTGSLSSGVVGNSCTPSLDYKI
jgi:hypothetical protein